jgi:hypothetical protein
MGCEMVKRIITPQGLKQRRLGYLGEATEEKETAG